ncbi:helix-turn-helix domain-containing protein [Streptomyces sp. NPDC003691]
MMPGPRGYADAGETAGAVAGRSRPADPGRTARDDGELASFYELIDSAIGACGDFRRAARRVEETLAVLRDARRPGPPPVLLGGTDMRRAWADFSAAMRDMNSAVTDARAEGYRAAVDDAGISLTDLARLSGHSRQHVTRLVNRGRGARDEE